MTRLSRAALRAGLVAAVVTLVAVSTAVPATAAGHGYVTGVVTGDGRPLQSVVVQAAIPRPPFGLQVLAAAVTDAHGAYRLEVPVTGDQVNVQYRAAGAVGGTSPTGYADSCHGGLPGECGFGAGGTVVVKAGVTRALKSWALPRAAEVRGRLTDGVGRGVGGMSVALYGGSGFCPGPLEDVVPLGVTTSDVNGNYRIPQLPAGPAGLCIGSYDRLPQDGTPGPFGYQNLVVRSVPLTGGTVTTTNRVMVGRGAVSGRLVDQDGAAVVDVQVYVEEGIQFDPQVMSDAQGRFSIRGVDVGTYPVCVFALQYDTPDCSAAGAATARVKPFTTTKFGTIVLHRRS